MFALLIIVIDFLFRILEAVLVIRVIISWLPISGNNQFVNLLYRVTEPILVPIRKILNKTPLGHNVMFDLSPIFAFLALGILRNILYSILSNIVVK
ncbi:MAG: YggT family protein [Clostridia bacterium]|jgi:YggT family protein